MIAAPAIPWAVIRLAAVLAAGGAIGAGLLVAAMTFQLLCPTRMREGRAMYFLRRLSPQDLGLAYEETSFAVSNRRTRRPIRLAGWWIGHPGGSERCVILLHGYGDAKVGGIAWAPLFQSLGFNVLAIDLRAHGQSQGTFTTAGYYERYDVTQVIDQLIQTRPAQTRKVVLFGVSLGAAVAAATAVLRDDLAAVILECPYVDFPRAFFSHADRLPVPGRIFQRMAIWLSRRLARIDYSEIRPVDLISQIRCPLLVVQSCEDSFVCQADQELIAAALAGRGADLPAGRLWRVSGSFHVLAMADEPAEYRRQIGEFLAGAIGGYSVSDRAGQT